MFKKLSLIVLFSVSLFAMHSVEININDKDLEIATNIDFGQLNDTVEPDTTFLSLKYLKASDENSDNRADIKEYADVSFLIKQEVANSGFLFGIGVKANYAKVKIANVNEYFVSIPLGLEAGYIFPTASIVPITLGVKLYYAPESLVFAEADSYLEYRVDASFEIIKRGLVIIGLRNIDTNYKIDSREIEINYNRSAYFGFRFSF